MAAPTFTFVKTPEVGVTNPPAGSLRLFADDADSIVKTKDENGVVRPAISGTATDLATTGDPVVIDSAGAPSPGHVLAATVGPANPVATWQNPRAAGVSTPVVQTAIQTGVISASIDQLVRVNISGGSSTVNLPTAVGNTNREIWVKLVSAASGNTCTIDAAGVETIDGAATLVMNTDYEWANLRSDGANWMQIG